MVYTQPEPYDYDEMPLYPPHRRPRYYYDPDPPNYHPPPPPSMNRHAYRDDRPYYRNHPYDDMPPPMMKRIPNHVRRRRMPKPNAFNNMRIYRRVRRKPAIRGYVYGFRANENDY